MAAPPPRYFDMMPPLPPPAQPQSAAPVPFYHSEPPPSYDHRFPPYHQQQNEIRTLFVSGLPDDVKPREIHNLFRRRPGFDSSQMKYTGRGDQVVAFVNFFDHHSAAVAMSELDGSIFDFENGTKLHIEFARTNSRTKRPQVGASIYTVIDKRVKVEKEKQDISSDDGDDRFNSDNDRADGTESLHATQSIENMEKKGGSQAATDEDDEKPSSKESQPCSTLFMANLGSNCTEEKIKGLLSQYSGFQALKMRGKRASVAFADFKDTECATEAMRNLEGTKLSPSETDGIHVEYAKSRMRQT